MLVLASASPRRQELLRNARVAFETQPADIPEILREGELPGDFARRLAREKSRVVFQTRRPRAGSFGSFVLGADTVVVVEGEVLGKPIDPNDASRMLRLLSGRWHEVTTGVCLMGEREESGCFEDVRSETTRVFFLPLTEEDISGYVATGEPIDKAGAYAIQGGASRWIPRIEGDYFNVMGLPISLVCRMLREHGDNSEL